jgi:anti-sigma B factor antagonist
MREAGELEIDVEDVAGARIVRVEGELDMATVGELENALGRIAADDRVILDLTACTFLDSSAVRVLVATARAAGDAGGTLSLVASSPTIVRVLEISAVDTMVPLHATLDAAL